jgi:hypothetical protein
MTERAARTGERRQDILGRHAVIAAVEPEAARGEIDDRNAAARLQAPDDITRVRSGIANVVEHRAHDNRLATAIRQVRSLARAFDDTNVGCLFARRAAGDGAPPIGIDVGRQDLPIRSDEPRDGDGVRSVTRSDVSDAIARSNPEEIGQPAWLVSPGEREKKNEKCAAAAISTVEPATASTNPAASQGLSSICHLLCRVTEPDAWSSWESLRKT